MLIFPPGLNHSIRINGVTISITNEGDVTITNVRFLDLEGQRVFLGPKLDQDTIDRVEEIKQRFINGEPEPLPEGVPTDHLDKSDTEILEKIFNKTEPLSEEEKTTVKEILEGANDGCAM